MQDFKELKQKINDTEEWLHKEFGQIRTGRATPTILDGVMVEAYGSQMPIAQMATVMSEDPRTLRIAPWDQGNVKPIEKAIQISNLGLSVIVDDKGLRVSFPALTTESRSNFVKIAKTKLEDAKVAVRQERNKANDILNAGKKDGSISEDDALRGKETVDKLIKEAGDKFDILFGKKESEILD